MRAKILCIAIAALSLTPAVRVLAGGPDPVWDPGSEPVDGTGATIPAIDALDSAPFLVCSDGGTSVTVIPNPFLEPVADVDRPGAC